MDDAYYIDRVLKGELNAFTPLVEKYRHYVTVLVKRTCVNPAEAEELAQDVFVKVYQHLGSFKGKATFSTWLYRIAFNTAVSHARKKKRYRVSIDEVTQSRYEVSDEEQQQGREEMIHTERKYEVLEELVATLPAEEQMLLSLYYKEGLKMDEVAYICGLSLSNAKVKIHRIRKKLNEIIIL